MTASDLVVGEIYEGGECEPRGKRRITEIQYGNVWYRPVQKNRQSGYGYNVRQDIASFLRWCNQGERQETAAAQNPACAQEQSSEEIRREGELAGMRKALEAVQGESAKRTHFSGSLKAGYVRGLEGAESAILAKMEEVKGTTNAK